MITLVFVAALAAPAAYYRRKQAKHDQWLDEMAQIGADLMCDRPVPGLKRKLLDLHVRAEQLVGESVDSPVSYAH